jgi:hypothetical protein
VKLVTSAATHTRHVDWLWDRRIPRGHLCGLVGEENFGKTTFLCWLTAAASTGRLNGDVVNTLFLTAEDSPSVTLNPRLTAAGADQEHVFYLPHRDPDDPEDFQYLTLPGGVSDLGKAIREHNIGHLILDPINAFMGGADGHKDTSVRAALGPLASLAEDANIAVTCVQHINKGQDKSERSAMVGSFAYRAAFRSTLIFGLDPDRPDPDGNHRVIVHGDKHNLSKRQAGFKVEVCERDVMLPDGIAYPYPYHVLGETTLVTPEEVLAASVEGRPRHAEALTEATHFLEEALADGPRAVKDVNKGAKELGITPATLRRAKVLLNVQSTQVGFHGGHQWSIPTGAHLDATGAHAQ